MSGARWIVAASTAVAVVAAGGLAYELFGRASVPSYGSYEACATPEADTDYLFGIGEVANEGLQNIELLSVEALTVRDLEVIDITVIDLNDEKNIGGIGVLEASESIFEEYNLSPVEGSVIAPGNSVKLVAQLKASAVDGSTTDFEVRYKNSYGIPLTARISNVVGFAIAGCN